MDFDEDFRKTVDIGVFMRSWKISEVPLRVIVDALEEDTTKFIDGRQSRAMSHGQQEGNNTRKLQDSLLPYAVRIRRGARKAVAFAVGLCLECVRAGGQNPGHKEEHDCD